MKRVLLGIFLLLAVGAAASAQTADVFKAECMSGKAGFEKKIKGQLVVDAKALIFKDGEKIIFTVPMVNVTKVTNEVQNNEGSMTRQFLIGGMSNKSEGFVYVSTETADAAEALVFKVDKNAPAGIVAKIEFAAKKAKEK